MLGCQGEGAVPVLIGAPRHALPPHRARVEIHDHACGLRAATIHAQRHPQHGFWERD